MALPLTLGNQTMVIDNECRNMPLPTLPQIRFFGELSSKTIDSSPSTGTWMTLPSRSFRKLSMEIEYLANMICLKSLFKTVHATIRRLDDSLLVCLVQWRQRLFFRSSLPIPCIPTRIDGHISRDYRCTSVNYRSNGPRRWKNPLLHVALSARCKCKIERQILFSNDRVGAGVQFFADKLGGFDFNTIRFHFWRLPQDAFMYLVSWYFHLVQAGIVQKCELRLPAFWWSIPRRFRIFQPPLRNRLPK